MNELNQIRLQRLGLILTSPTYAYKALKGLIEPLSRGLRYRTVRKAWLDKHMVINFLYIMLVGILCVSSVLALLAKYAMWGIAEGYAPWKLIVAPFGAILFFLVCFVVGVMAREFFFKDI